MDAVRRLLPEISFSLRKGSCGRLGILGGSAEYTGAPYFAAISMLKVGADMAHVFTTPEASPVIKGYSPELIVHPQLNPGDWLQRMDALLVGSGLCREKPAMDQARASLAEAAKNGLPTVVDADGLWAVTESWEEVVAGREGHEDSPLILTPNPPEMDRLTKKVLGVETLGKSKEEIKDAATKLAEKLKMNILVKGGSDLFVKPDGEVHIFDERGSPCRPGGMGDTLAGVLTAFAFWAHRDGKPLEDAAEAASFITRECAKRAYDEIGRGMTATDVINLLAPLIKQIDKAAKI